MAIPVMVDLGRFAMPQTQFRDVVKLAESGNSLDQGVAYYMAEASRETLAAPFEDYQRIKVGMSVATQRTLAGIPTTTLSDYTLCRERFEKAEKIFQADVQEVLRMHKQRTPTEMRLALSWRYPQYPHPVLRMVA